MTFSGGIPTFMRKDVSVNLPMCDKWRPEEAVSYRVFMHGGKAVCTMVLGKPSISVLPIFATDNFFIFSAVSVISCGNFGLSFASSRFSMCFRTSSLSSLAVSFLVR